MKILKLITAAFAVAITMLLAACGGGGGSPGANPNQPNLTTTAPSIVTLMPGTSGTYQVSGGVPPYRVGNSEARIAAGTLDGTRLVISAYVAGNATVDLIDNTGAKITIGVAVGSSTPLHTTAPMPVVLLPGSGVQYEIAGGVPPYRVVSSDVQIATASVDGAKFQINGRAAGDTTVNVLDSTGAGVAVAVRVGASVALMTTAPSPVVLTPGASGRYEISGGVPPYRVGNSNQAVAVGDVAGNGLNIRGIAVGSARVEVFDSTGAKVGIDVTVSSGSNLPLTVTAPSPVTLFPGANGQYDILGGMAPYRVSSSNTQVANASVDGSRLMVSAVAAGNATISVVDGAGMRVNVNVIVGAAAALSSSAPAALTVGVGPTSTRTFTIQGGVAPYVVQGSNQNAFTVARSGNDFSVTGVAIGSGTITITDAANNRISVSVTVGAPELRISPTDLKIFPGIDAVAKISGGQPPYQVAGGIPSAIQVTVVGDELRIKALLASKLDVTVADATGQTAKITVEDVNGTGQFNIMPGALSITEDDNQPIRLNLYGAAPGAVCFYTDRTQLAPRENGCPNNPATVTLVTGPAGSRCVNGNTPVMLTAVDSTGAVASAVVTIVDNGKCSPGAALSVTGAALQNGTVTVTAAQVGPPPVAATSAELLVFGGSGQYTVTSSNTGAATATIAGNVLAIKGGTTPGNSTVTVYDQQNLNISRQIAVVAN